MHAAALMGKSSITDIGRMRVRHSVDPAVDHSGQRFKLTQLFLRHPCLIAIFQHQIRDQADQVGVTATLTDAVDCALNLTRAGLNRNETVGHSNTAIIMTVDTDIGIRQRFTNSSYTSADFFGH